MDQEPDSQNQLTTPIKKLDRTPYTSFIWLSLILILIFFMGFYLLWQSGSYIKKQNWYKFVTGQKNVSIENVLPSKDKATGIYDSIKNKINGTANDAATSAKDAVKDQANTAADQAVSNTTNQINKASQNGIDTLQQESTTIKENLTQ